MRGRFASGSPLGLALDVEEEDEVVAVVHFGWVGWLDGGGLFFLGEEVFALVVVAEDEEALFFQVVGFAAFFFRGLRPFDLTDESVELRLAAGIEVTPVVGGKLLDAREDGGGGGAG